MELKIFSFVFARNYYGYRRILVRLWLFFRLSFSNRSYFEERTLGLILEALLGPERLENTNNRGRLLVAI